MSGARQSATARARARAREAKARLDAERAVEEKRVEDLVTEWYVAQDAHEQAEQALADAEAARAAVVAQLLETQSVDRVAGLCGLDRADIGRLRRRAAADARRQGEDASDALDREEAVGGPATKKPPTESVADPKRDGALEAPAGSVVHASGRVAVSH